MQFFKYLPLIRLQNSRCGHNVLLQAIDQGNGELLIDLVHVSNQN